MRYVCLFALHDSADSVRQDGAAIYKERCASCHDMPAGSRPSLTTIKAMSGEAIYMALTSGIMKTQAEGLSTARDLRVDRLYCAHRRSARSRSATRPHLQRRRSFSIQRKFAAMERLEHQALRTRDSRMPPRPD